MATKTKAKKKATKKKPQARPSTVDYLEVGAGRRNQQGELVPLFARVEKRDGVVSASLGSDFNKLQIRVTLEALREVVKKMEALQ